MAVERGREEPSVSSAEEAEQHSSFFLVASRKQQKAEEDNGQLEGNKVWGRRENGEHRLVRQFPSHFDPFLEIESKMKV